jgi:hypothetical protein
MENDDEDTFVRLGDVVARIAQRLEGEVIAEQPPVPNDEALLFVRILSGEIFGPPRAGASRHTQEQVEGEVSARAGQPHSGAGRS